MKKVLLMTVILLFGLVAGVSADAVLPDDSTGVQGVPESAKGTSEETGDQGGMNEKVIAEKNSTSDTKVSKQNGTTVRCLNKRTARRRIVRGGFRGWRQVR